MNRTVSSRTKWHWLVAATSLFLTCVLAAWIAFPWWAQFAVSSVLPVEWQLTRLDVKRPGLSTIPISTFSLESSLPGFRVQIEASGASVRLNGSGIEVDNLVVRLHPEASKLSGTPDRIQPFIEKWSLPRVVPPGGLPRVEIGRLEWTLGTGESAQQGLLEDLVFGENEAAVTLETALRPIPLLKRAGTLTTRLSEDGFFLDILTNEEQPKRVFFYRQASVPESGKLDDQVIATLQFDLDLADLDRDAITPFTASLSPARLDHAEGQITAAMQFQGRERLAPLAFSVKSDGLVMALGDELLRLDGAIHGGLIESSLNFELESLSTELVTGEQRLSPLLSSWMAQLGITGLSTGPTRFSLKSLQSWQGRLNPTQGNLMSWSGALEADIALPGAGAQLTLQRGILDRTDGKPLQFQADIDASFEHEGTLVYRQAPARLEVDQAAIAFSASLEWYDDDWRLSNGRVSQLHAARALLQAGGDYLVLSAAESSGEFGWGKHPFYRGPIKGADLTVGEADAGSPMFESDTVAGSIDASITEHIELSGNLVFEGSQLPVDNVSMDVLEVVLQAITLPETNGQLSILTTGLEIPIFDRSSSGVELNLDSEIRDGSPFQGKGELLIGYSGSLPFAFHSNEETGNLVIDLDESPLQASALPTLLSLVDSSWATPLSPDEGQIILDGSIELIEKEGNTLPTGVLRVDSDDLAFCYGKSCIRDLDLHGSWDLADQLNGTSSLSIGEFDLAAGLNMSSFSTTLMVENDTQITLEGLSADLLGGELAATTIRFENSAMAGTTITWSELDLAKLLLFLDVGGLEGTGYMDAELPITNTNGNYGIFDGHFGSRGAGTIRYRSGVPAANIGMQALENFQFDSLDGTIDYHPDGRYSLLVTLNGRNPELYGGHPIRFNLNISGELPSLFKTLFITGDFGQAILDQVRSGKASIEGPGS